MLLIAAGGLVVGLAIPAAAHEAGTLINGKSIVKDSIPGNRLENNTVTGKQIKESTLGRVPKATAAKTATEARRLPALAWHPITTFVDEWGNAGSGAPVAAYAVDSQGVVHLRGVVMNTIGADQNAVAFALPASAVPATTTASVPVGLGAGAGAYPGVLAVGADLVSIIAQGAGASTAAATSTNLNGITFIAA
jgi:hypothetical protein